MSTSEHIVSEDNTPCMPIPEAKPSCTQSSQQQQASPPPSQPIDQVKVEENADPTAAAAAASGPTKMDDDNFPLNFSVRKHFMQLKMARKLRGIQAARGEKKMRLNQRLGKVIKPKNGLLLFNELQKKPKFSVRENYYPEYRSFVVTLEVDGKSYDAEDRSVCDAKMIASDMALRDIFIEHLIKSNETNTGDQTTTEGATRNVIPWTALGSYAVYLLFKRWGMDLAVSGSRTRLVDMESFSQDLYKPKSRDPFWGTPYPRSPCFVKELIDCPLPMVVPIYPNKPDIKNVFGVLNIVFPGIPIVEQHYCGDPNTRYKFMCKIVGVVYESSGPKKKPALQFLAIQILKTVGIEFENEETATETADVMMVEA